MLAFLEGVRDPPAAAHKRAIVTLAVGEDFLRLWQSLSQDSWEKYAKKYGYDIIVITERLDLSPRGLRLSPSWHKLLVFSQSWASRYERIVWVDADVIISPKAIDIVTYVPDATKVGICDGNAQLSPDGQHIYKERLHSMTIEPSMAKKFVIECSRANYEREGIYSDNPVEFNAGIFVASPSHHADFLRDIYYQYDEKCRLYEQIPLSHALTQAGMAEVLSNRFNWCMHPVMMMSYLNSMDDVSADHMVHFLRNELDKAYFLHFAGCGELLKVLDVWREATKSNPLFAA